MSLSSPYASPLFDPLRRWLDVLPPSPDTRAVAALAERFPIHTENGRQVRFVPPQADGLAYECRIWESGEVETRPDNWHDFFNALVWFAFPRTKIAVSARHVRAMALAGAPRGAARDALTHFDECGVVVLSTCPELLELLRNFAWKELFVVRREAVKQAMRFVIFGHATYDQLRQPYRGLTAKAVLYEIGEDWLQQPVEAQLAELDGRLADDLASGRYARPGDFQPLPLLGIPGLTPDSEQPTYYDDTWQFRPGRRPIQPLVETKAEILPDIG